MSMYDKNHYNIVVEIQYCITLQYCKVISLQLIKINEKKKKKKQKERMELMLYEAR